MENSVQVPKFDGKNFASWKFRIVSILEGKELDDLLEGDPPEDEVKFKEWKKKDAQAKGIITCAMTDSLVALILNCKTSKDIWIALHERYEGDKKKKIIEARNDVSRLTMKKEENWEEYLYRSEKLLEQARNLGAEIEDQEFTTSVIRGLPQKYNLVALQLNCQMKNHHVWDLTELPEGAKAIKSKWIFSKKMDPQTNQEIYKARLVALGCSQEYGTDYTETFSPVMKTDSFRTLLAYATIAGYEFHHFDVETAFLYGKLSETIYITQPPGYQDDKKKTSEIGGEGFDDFGEDDIEELLVDEALNDDDILESMVDTTKDFETV
ncbi:hypothetical protein LAZ67_9002232 [Cordylochernes scorpioides]|uniref:Reverse transcriptase Ty1/copia-type domain-containing protein n=1 Tax=Cordylochernes scorpioides TaxID=51811 RepID=A0ABY6KTN4_9ARAC|nr:hypothetical protein LAZ67_9002232 [Cordylochernes scorpioides]